MSTEQLVRKVDDILRRLDLLEATTRINYAKGTWTPVITGGTTAGVANTYNVQAGTWVRIGSRVYYDCSVDWSGGHTGTGQIRVTGLAHTALDRIAVTIWTSGITFAGAAPQARIAITNYVELSYPVTNAAPTVIAIEAAGTITLSWHMRIA